jgi:hypothetical protein
MWGRPDLNRRPFPETALGCFYGFPYDRSRTSSFRSLRSVNPFGWGSGARRHSCLDYGPMITLRMT